MRRRYLRIRCGVGATRRHWLVSRWQNIVCRPCQLDNAEPSDDYPPLVEAHERIRELENELKEIKQAIEEEAEFRESGGLSSQ